MVPDVGASGRSEPILGNSTLNSAGFYEGTDGGLVPGTSGDPTEDSDSGARGVVPKGHLVSPDGDLLLHRGSIFFEGAHECLNVKVAVKLFNRGIIGGPGGVFCIMV